MKKFGKKSKFYEVKNLKYVILNRLFIFFCKKSYKDFVFNIKSKSKIRETQVKILLEILKRPNPNNLIVSISSLFSVK